MSTNERELLNYEEEEEEEEEISTNEVSGKTYI